MENEQKIAEEADNQGGLFKSIIIFLVFFAVAVGYYLFLDYSLMSVQNLKFPYSG